MNLINNQFELWIPTDNVNNRNDTVIEISNCGRIRRKNGVIEYSKLYHSINYKGKIDRIHRIICNNFNTRTEEDIRLNRNTVDHITHNPSNYNYNDIRNLRWCTQKENNNFKESRSNRSHPHSDSEFGKLYFNKYGYSKSHDVIQYKRELNYYLKYGKLRNEAEIVREEPVHKEESKTK